MSGNGSADVSVPTDLTVTSHADSEEDYAATRRSGQVKVDINLKVGSSILMPSFLFGLPWDMCSLLAHP